MMKFAKLFLQILQPILIGCAVIMDIWVELPRATLAGLLVIGVNLTLFNNTSLKAHRQALKWGLSIAWLSTIIVWTSLVLTRHLSDNYYGWMGWLVSLSLLIISLNADGDAKTRWRQLTILWAFIGSFIWLADAYIRNNSLLFYTVLLVLLALLILCKVWFHLQGGWVQCVNTLLFLLVMLPLVDLLIRPRYRLDVRPELDLKYHSYAAAKKDPVAFMRWWDFYVEQWNLMSKEVFYPDPERALPFRLRPNSHGFLFKSPISINSKGFRGKEITEPKGNTFRIVALGESTTYGCTLLAEDRPWPEVLEQIIHERLKPPRPVEVINAGVPAYNLEHNLHRLARDILPLQPDMIISYHGYNGFSLLRTEKLRAQTKPPPAYQERPLKLLADCEYRLRMLLYKRDQILKDEPGESVVAKPMATKYAQAYNELIAFAQTNRIKLALANFSMAANDRSDVGVVEFYRSRFPSVYWQIKANLGHSELLMDLGKQHPEICIVDAQPHLDGEHDKFIDLVHFTQEGRQQLAENIFAGIRVVLQKDLATPERNVETH